MIKKNTKECRVTRLNFERTFGIHSVNTFVAYGQSKFYSEFTCFHRDNFISTTIPQLDFGRVNYNYKNICFFEEYFAATSHINFPKPKGLDDFRLFQRVLNYLNWDGSSSFSLSIINRVIIW